MELIQRLEDMQTPYAALAKEVYNLKQYIITQMVSCISDTDTLEGQT